MDPRDSPGGPKRKNTKTASRKYSSSPVKPFFLVYLSSVIPFSTFSINSNGMAGELLDDQK